jgi:ankyrin repeat protein
LIFLSVCFLLWTTAIPSCAAEGIDQLYSAIRGDDLQALRGLLDKGVSPDSSDDRQITALMYAAAIGSIDAMKELLAEGAQVNAQNAFGSTALMWSVTDARKVRLLLDHGADVNQVAKSGYTALISAALTSPSAEVVRMLLQRGADAKATAQNGMTTLNAAAHGNDTGTIEMLVKAGVDVNAATTMGMTPLINASANGNLTAVKLLLAKGADINQMTARDKVLRVKNGVVATGGLTPLMRASVYGPPELVKVLLDGRAQVNAVDVKGMTPLMFSVATDHQNPKILQILLACGADRDKKSLAGETALDWARKVGGKGAILTLGTTPTPRDSADTAARPRPALRDAVQRSIGLLEKSSAEYIVKSGCPGCHAQVITNFAVAAARTKDISLDQKLARDRMHQLASPLTSVGPALLEGRDPVGTEPILFGAEALAQGGYPPNRGTDLMVAAIAAHQQQDGNWHVLMSRTPIVDGDFTSTALGIRALKVYGTPGRTQEMTQRIERAKQWLLSATPVSAEDRDMRLVGVASAGASREVLSSLAKPILAHQRTDGGWAQRDELASDAYGTGMTLWALAEAGIVDPHQDVYQRGVRFLLSTQHADGSWYVASRAVKIQPYFEGGFPYGHDQWISSMATGWAATALALAINRR